MLVHRRVTPSSKFAGTHLYTWVERSTMRVKYLAQEHKAVARPGLEPGPPDPESSALTIRPPRLPPKSPLFGVYTFGRLLPLFPFVPQPVMWQMEPDENSESGRQTGLTLLLYFRVLFSFNNATSLLYLQVMLYRGCLKSFLMAISCSKPSALLRWCSPGFK